MTQDPHPSDRPDPSSSQPESGGASAPSEQPTGAVPPPAPGYGQPGQPGYGQPPHGQPGYAPGQVPGAGMPPGYPYAYPRPTPPNVSAIVLTVVSGLTILTGYCCIIGIVPLVFGILGITQQASDPENAARMTRIGWIIFAVMTVLVLLAVGGILLAVMAGGSTYTW